MKKHIFGVALFSLIIATFAFIYAFFFAPSIPPKEAVKPPVSRSEIEPVEKPTTCFPKRAKNFYYTVESANYYVEKNTLKSKLTLYWNGPGEAPKKISIQPRVFIIDDSENAKSVNSVTFIEPFKDSSQKTITIESKFDASNFGENPPNLYVLFDVLDGINGNFLTTEKGFASESFHVLFVYPEQSFSKNEKFIVRGTTIPQ